jgi:putative transposase
MPRSHALRQGRYSKANLIYVVTTVCADRKPLFASFLNARALVCSLQQTEASALTLCFVVMPDHLHWMLQLKEGAQLSTTVRFVKAQTTRKLKARWPGVGTVWQRGFHDHAVRGEENLRGLARYIIANPVRAGLARSAAHYSHWDCLWL